MRRSEKNKKSLERLPEGKRTPAGTEPLRPKAKGIDKLCNDLAKFPEENPYPVLRIHKDATVLYANKPAEPLLKARGSEVGRLAPAEWRRLVEEVLKSGRVANVEVKQDGHIIAFRAVPVIKSDYVNLYGIDVTEQKMAEEERELTIKLLSLINSRNRLQELLKLVTILLRDWSGCEAAGIRLQDGEDFPYFVTNGFSSEFILAENNLCSVNEVGEVIRDSQGRPYLECMCGNIISGRFDPSRPFFTGYGSFWTNSTTDLLASTTNADRLTKTRNRCNAAGYESVALIPLRAGDVTFGLLQFNGKQRDCFNPEKISLLERLADNLAIGLAQRKAEQALRESEDRLKTVLDAAGLGTWDWDLLSRKTVWTGHTQQLLGFKENEFDGRFETFESRIHPEDKLGRAEVVEKAKTERTEYLHEYRVIWPDKTVHWVASRGRFQYDKAGRAVRFLGVINDLTKLKNIEEDLRKERDFAKKLVETAQAIVLVLDTRGHIVSFNPYMEEISGYKLEEVLGLDWFSTFLPQRDRERTRELFKNATADIQTRGNVNAIVTKSGSKRYIEWNDKTLKDKSGNIVGLLSIGQDITERKKAEYSLKKNEERFKQVAECSGTWIWEVDSKGLYTYASPVAENLLGYKPEEIVGKKHFYDFFTPDSKESLKKTAFEVFGKKESFINFVNPVIHKNGNTVILETTRTPILDDEGNLCGYRGADRDITERKNAEELLKTSEAKLSDAMKIAKLGYWEYDFATDLFTFNDQFYSIYRTTAEKVGGYTMPSARYAELFIPPEERDIVGYEIKKAIEAAEPNFSRQLEHRIIYADGESGYIAVRFFIIKDSRGRTIKTYGANQDITERKIVEDKLLEYQKQLKKLASQLALAEEQERRRIAASLHDEVSQSLALAKIKLDSLRLSGSDPQITAIEEISSALENAIQQTRSLTFDLSYPVLYEIGFEAAVSEWLDEQLHDKYGIETYFQDDGLAKPLDNDVRAILFRNIRELLTNIVKHAKAKKASVSIQKDGNFIKVAVADDGVGFDSAEIRKNAAKKTKFGLFSIRESLELMGGRLEIESKPGAGCKAIMTAPLKRKEMDDERN